MAKWTTSDALGQNECDEDGNERYTVHYLRYLLRCSQRELTTAEEHARERRDIVEALRQVIAEREAEWEE